MENFSVIIPIYNEAHYLTGQIQRLIRAIDAQHFPTRYEIILVENGSTDSTYRIASKLAKAYPQVRVVRIDQPSYGQAFKAGIAHARYPLLFQFDLDFWDIDFLCMSLAIFDRYDIVIGSKNLAYSHDNRSLTRRFMSGCIERIIQWRFGVTLTDTHGLKAMRRSCLLPLLADVVCTNHFFDSELLLRCSYQGCKIKELPVDLTEIRASRFPFLVRFLEVAKEAWTLLTVSVHRRRHSRLPVIHRPALAR